MMTKSLDSGARISSNLSSATYVWDLVKLRKLFASVSSSGDDHGIQSWVFLQGLDWMTQVNHLVNHNEVLGKCQIIISNENLEVSVELCQLSHSNDFISHLIMWEIELSIFVSIPKCPDCHVAGIGLVTKENLRYFYAPDDFAI